MANRFTPALRLRETKLFETTKHFRPSRGTRTVLLLSLSIAILLCLPNRDRNAFESVQVGMPRENLIQTLAGLKVTITRDRDQETSTWLDRVKFPLRQYQVTIRDGKVTDKRVLP